MKNALSIDLEYWHSAELLRNYIPEEYEDLLIESTDVLLNLLKKNNTSATFFVLGSVAEKYPNYIKMIHESGHEIGSHAYSHKTLQNLGQYEFEQELIRSTNILRSITHEQPIGFRAPSFSINQSTNWAFTSLEKCGYKYDSSIFPINTMLYGVPNAPTIPYRPLLVDITKVDPEGKIIEFPLTTIKLLKNIPISGGFYLRALPLWFLNASIDYINMERPALLYIHPWETYGGTPRLNVPFKSKLITYHGIDGALNKFEKLLLKYNFCTIREVLNL